MATSEQPDSKNAPSSDEQSSTDDRDTEREREPATVSHGGCCINVTPNDIRKMGYNPNELDAVRLRVVNGGILLEPVE